MSDRRPIATIGIRRKEGDQWRSYSVIAVWPTQHDGLYNGNVDKGTDRRPAMGVIDAIKALGAGASLEIRVNQPAQKSGGNYDRPGSNTDEDDFGF